MLAVFASGSAGSDTDADAIPACDKIATFGSKGANKDEASASKLQYL